MIAARWVHFVSLFVLFGSSFFWVHMGREAWNGVVTRLPASLARIERLNLLMGPVVALSGVAWLIGSIANMTGDLAGVFDRETLRAFFFETSFGPIALARLLLFAGIIAATTTRVGFAILGVSSGLLLCSQAWLGHAAEDGGTLYGFAMIASYAVHVLAGAAWLGGLVPLLLAIAEHAGDGSIPDIARVLHLLMRFSAMAIVAVTAIIVSGVANSAFRIGLPTLSMSSSPYVRILGVKIGLVLGMLVLAGLNRFVLMPGLRQKSERPRLSAVTSSIVAESVLGITVLGAAALLGITPPPR